MQAASVEMCHVLEKGTDLAFIIVRAGLWSLQTSSAVKSVIMNDLTGRWSKKPA